MRPARTLGAIAAVAAGLACGQKGPPLAPLRLVPAAVTDMSLSRVEDRARLRFVLPTGNANGPGPIELDRVEIYAVTVGPGSAVPPNRDLLTRTYLVGHVAVKPPPREGEGEAVTPVPPDPRPAPGEAVTFDEALTEAVVTPAPLPAETPAPAPAKPAPPAGAAATAPAVAAPSTPEPDAAVPVVPELPQPPAETTPLPGAPPAAPDPAAVPPDAKVPPAAGTTEPGGGVAATPAMPAAAKPAARTEPVRIYVARGVTRGGRAGPASSRVELPLGPLPPAPGEPQTRVTESGVVVEWAPPDDAAGLAFNVYEAGRPATPLNAAPLAEPSFEHGAAVLGEEHCYQVRSVRALGAVGIEGPASAAACITPRDIFPPAAPTGLAAVPTPGQISLIWDANTESDLAGYIVLRGDAPDGQLQPLTPAAIRETSYRDTTVQPGVRYVYAIIAVDSASPPNTSATSERVEETAR